jgi:hypothetical protein
MEFRLGDDAFAWVIGKSRGQPFKPVVDPGSITAVRGGKTRRAAKMVILDADHPTSSISSTVKLKRRRRPGRSSTRLQRVLHRSGVFVGLLPELEQERARDGRVQQFVALPHHLVL